MTMHAAIELQKARNYSSIGMHVATICQVCGKRKAGVSHPKCSREMQRRRERGEL